MPWCDVYLSLGGNIGDTPVILRRALQYIASLNGVRNVKVSRFYQTTPISDMAQDLFVNAVCYVETLLDVRTLFDKLVEIEMLLGKTPKPKNAPRVIDIDLLFYGTERCASQELEVPHPRWRERLFVIKPLLDLVQTITVPDSNKVGSLEIVDLVELMRTFPNPHCEEVIPLPGSNFAFGPGQN